MLTLYKIIINILYAVAWPYFVLKGRKATEEWRQRRGIGAADYLAGVNDKTIWLHASSVGEVRVVERLIAALKAVRPELSIAVSTYTHTGQELAKELFPDAAAVLYFPIDSYVPLKRLFEVFKPAGIVIVETEIWPYFLSFCKRLDIPVVLANGRLSEKSTKSYSKFKKSLGRALSVYRAFIMQSKSDAERMISIGADESRITVLGNVKHDQDPDFDRKVNRKRVRSQMGFPSNAIFFIAASTRPGEEKIICEILGNLTQASRPVITLVAPRHLERIEEVRTILDSHRIRHCLYSEYSEQKTPCTVILMDSMGLLTDLFYGADIAFVGGTMADIGGHNVMEPVLAGAPVVFGPSTFNVTEAAEEIVARNWGRQVMNRKQLLDVLQDFIDGKTTFAMHTEGGTSVARQTAEIIARELHL